MKSVKSQHFSYLSIFQLILKPIIKQPKNKPYQNHKNQFKKFVARVLIFFQIYSSLFQGIAYGGYGLLENLPIQDEIYLHGGYAKDGGLRLSLWTSTLTSQKTELLKEIEIPTYEVVKARSRTNSRASSPSPALQLPTSNLSPPSISDSLPSQNPPSSFSPLPIIDAEQPTEIFSDQDSMLAALTDQEDMSDEENSAFESEEGILRTPEGAHFNIQGLKVFLSNSGELLVQGKQEDFSHPILLSSDRSIVLHEVEAFALKLTSGSIISVGESKIDFLSLEGSADDRAIMPQFLNQGSLSAKAIFLKNLNNANSGRLTTDTIEIPEGIFENLGNLRVKEQMTLNAERFTNRGIAAISTLQVLDSVRRLENTENAELEFMQPVYLPPSTATVNEGTMKGSIQSQGTIFNQGFLEGDFLKTSEILTNRGILRSRNIEANGPSFEQTGTITARRLQIGQDTQVITSAAQKLELTEAIESHSQSPWMLEGTIITSTFSHLGRLELVGELITEQFEGHGIINERGRLKAQESRFTDATTILGRATLQHVDASGDVVVEGIVTVRDQATIDGRLYVRENGMLKGKKTKPLTLTLQDGGEIAGLVDVDYLSATKPLTLMPKGKLVSRQSTYFQEDLTIHTEASAELHYLSNANGVFENHGDLTIIGVRPGSQLNLVNNGIAHVDEENPIANTASFAIPNPDYDTEFAGMNQTQAKLKATYYKSLLLPSVGAGQIDPEFANLSEEDAQKKGFEYKQQFLDLARGTSLEELEADYQALHKRLYAATHADSDRDTASQKFGSITPINFSAFETLSFSELVEQLKKNALDYALPLPTDIEKRSYTYLENLARHQQNAIRQLSLTLRTLLPIEAIRIPSAFIEPRAKEAAWKLSQQLGLRAYEQQKSIRNLSYIGAMKKLGELQKIYKKKYLTEHPELVQQAWAETSEQSPVYLDKILDIESPNGKNLAQLRASGIGYYRKAGLLTPEKYAEFKEKNLAQMRAAAIHAAKAYREKALQDNPYLLQQARDNALIAADEQLMQQEIEKLLPQKFQRNYIRRLLIHDTRDLAIESSKLLGKAEEEIKLLRGMNVYDMHDKLIELQNQIKPKYIADHPEIIMQAREATRTAVQYLKRLGQQIIAYKNLAAEIFKVNLQAVNHSTGQLTLKSGRFDFTDAGAFVNEGTLVQEQAAVHWLAKASEDFNTGTWRVKGSLELDGYRAENLGVLEVNGTLHVVTPLDAMEAFKGLAKVKTQRLVMHAPSLRDVTPEDKILPWVLELHLAQDFENVGGIRTYGLQLFCENFKAHADVTAALREGAVVEQADLDGFLDVTIRNKGAIGLNSSLWGKQGVRIRSKILHLEGQQRIPGAAAPNVLYKINDNGIYGKDGPIVLEITEEFTNHFGTIHAPFYIIKGKLFHNIAGLIQGLDATQQSQIIVETLRNIREISSAYSYIGRKAYGRDSKGKCAFRNKAKCNCDGSTVHEATFSAGYETSPQSVIEHAGDLLLIYRNLEMEVSHLSSAKTLTLDARRADQSLEVGGEGNAVFLEENELPKTRNPHQGMTLTWDRNQQFSFMRGKYSVQGNLGNAKLSGGVRGGAVAFRAVQMLFENTQADRKQQEMLIRLGQFIQSSNSSLYKRIDDSDIYDTRFPLNHTIPKAIVGIGALPGEINFPAYFSAMNHAFGKNMAYVYLGIEALGLTFAQLCEFHAGELRNREGSQVRRYIIKDREESYPVDVVTHPDVMSIEALKVSPLPLLMMEFGKGIIRAEDEARRQAQEKAAKAKSQTLSDQAEATMHQPVMPNADIVMRIPEQRHLRGVEATEEDATLVTQGPLSVFTNVSGNNIGMVSEEDTVTFGSNIRRHYHANGFTDEFDQSTANAKKKLLIQGQTGVNLAAVHTKSGKRTKINAVTGAVIDRSMVTTTYTEEHHSNKKEDTTIKRTYHHHNVSTHESDKSVKDSVNISGDDIYQYGTQLSNAQMSTHRDTGEIKQFDVVDESYVDVTTVKKKKSWFGGSRNKISNAVTRSSSSKGCHSDGMAFLVRTGLYEAVNPTMKAKRSDITAKKSIQIQAGVNSSQSVTQTSSQGTIWNKRRMTQESRTTHVNPRMEGNIYFHTPKVTIQKRAGSGPIANITSDVPIHYLDMIDQHHYTSKSQKSLSAGAAMIVRLGVALLVANPFAGGGLSSTMAGAGFDTLCSETAINMIENDGNPGRALQAMREKNIVKTVARSVAAAGLTGTLGAGTASTSVEGFAKEFLARSAVNTTMAIAFDGVKPGEAIRQGALNAAVQTVGACIANKIGDMADSKMGTEQIGDITQEIFHGFLGAGIGAGTAAIMGQDIGKGAASGAIGAVVGHSTAKISGSKALGDLVAVTVAMMTDQDLGIAYMASSNATEHNFNRHKANPIEGLVKAVKEGMQPQEGENVSQEQTDYMQGRDEYVNKALEKASQKQGGYLSAYEINHVIETASNMYAYKYTADKMKALAGQTVVKGAEALIPGMQGVNQAWMGVVNHARGELPEGALANEVLSGIHSSLIDGALTVVTLGVSKYYRTAKVAVGAVKAAATLEAGSVALSPKAKIYLDRKLFQEHHIISNKHPATQNHDLLKLADFDLNSSANKMFLPTRSGANISTTSRSIHEGRHLESVSQRLAEEMNFAVTRGQPLGWAQPQYHNELMQILSKERTALKSGDRILNTHHRPWATNGGGNR